MCLDRAGAIDLEACDVWGSVAKYGIVSNGSGSVVTLKRDTQVRAFVLPAL